MDLFLKTIAVLLIWPALSWGSLVEDIEAGSGAEIASIGNYNCLTHTLSFINYTPTTTAPQIAAANAIIAAYDCDKGNAQDGFMRSQSPEGKAIRAAASVLVDEVNRILAAIPRPITSITRTGTTATVTTPTAHGLANGTVGVTGADVAAYNGLKTITVTGANTFTYNVSGNPASPATGSIFYALDPTAAPTARTIQQLKAAITARIKDGTAD